MVQTRWEHLNEDYSILTKIQALALDGHFVIEQTVRNKAGFFINFNGTGGVWRKDCIEDAGSSFISATSRPPQNCPPK